MGVVTGVDGFGKLEKKLKRYSNPEQYFDDEIYTAVKDASDKMREATPKYTFDKGNDNATARHWQRVKKQADSVYSMDNTATSRDKKHSIVNIIRYGRGPVKPKKKPLLFIPQNPMTAMNAQHGYYRSDLKFGLAKDGGDYVMSKGVGPSKPNDFVTPVEDELKKDMIKNVTKRIKKDFPNG